VRVDDGNSRELLPSRWNDRSSREARQEVAPVHGGILERQR